MIDFERRAGKPRNVNVISIIDVMLVLLIFFMLAGTMGKVDVLPVDLPIAETRQTTDEGEVVVTLGRYQEIVANDELMTTPEELQLWVAQKIRTTPNIRVTLKADARMKAEELIDVMKLLETAGAREVVLATQEL